MPTTWYSATCKDCAVQISTQQTTALDFCQCPCSPQGGCPLGKQLIPRGQSEDCRVPGHVHLQRQRTETACHTDATSKANVSPAASTGAWVTTRFSPCSLQLRSLRQFTFLHLWSCHRRMPLPAVCHRATLWKMLRTYSVFVITSACGFRNPLSHLLPFHCQKSKQFFKIQNNSTAVYFHFALTHLFLFLLLANICAIKLH